MERSRTKLVCTIGPASAERIGELVGSGMDVARINFSHGTADDHRTYVHAVRAAAHNARRSVAVMGDLPGPKLRLGDLEGGELVLATGDTFDLPPEMGSQLEAGDRVLLADGAVELRVTAANGEHVTTEVVHGGLVRSRAGVNIPGGRLMGDGLTDTDRAAVQRALELRVDLIAQSLVRSADDVRALRTLLPPDGPRVVAKVETQAAVDGFDAILEVADGIMVARGDLGIDVPLEDVPLIQKDLVRRASAAGRFTIVATQMLESMTAAARPSRAEVSDVANAVLDGTDAVMLSAETAIGAFPLEALQAMERICQRAERGAPDHWLEHGGSSDFESDASTIVAAASGIAHFASGSGKGPGAIWCFTRSGRTAELLAVSRPHVPIVAFTLSPIVARRLAVRRGVIPMVLPANAGRGEPLIARMASAWRAQRNHHGDYRRVILITTSSADAGINRFEIHQLKG